MGTYFTYNKGNNTIYLTTQKYKMLENSYYKSRGIEAPKYRNYLTPIEQSQWEYFENALINMNSQGKEYFSNFLLDGEEAQSEVYDLLFNFCLVHNNCDLARKKQPYGYTIPGVVDICKENTFGKEFYITETFYISKFPEKRVTRSCYPISVPSIGRIVGTFQSFQILFYNNYVLTFEESDNVRYAHIEMLFYDSIRNKK